MQLLYDHAMEAAREMICIHISNLLNIAPRVNHPGRFYLSSYFTTPHVLLLRMEINHR